MKYNEILGEEIGQKSLSPNVVAGGEKERREIEKMERRKRKVLLKF